jgi:hypothetical protein
MASSSAMALSNVPAQRFAALIFEFGEPMI